ncbi:MAG: DUF6505 family protein [Rhodospirillales bacterium]
MKFPRTIRLDVSDVNAFPLAAEPEEWAVTGTFEFSDADPAAMTGKQQLAFKNGWLGLGTFGRSTFAQVADISDAEFEGAVHSLAQHLMDRYGAPDLAAATQAARDEALYTVELCIHPPNTLLAIEREFTEQGVAEKIHLIPKADDGAHAKIWTVSEED